MLLPVETALDDIPALAVSPADAARLNRGQAALFADGTLPSSAARSRSLRADSSWQLPRSIAAKSSPSACSTYPA